MPNKGEVSLANTSGLSELDIWAHLDEFVFRNPKARADLTYEKIIELNREQNTNLRAKCDRYPPRHIGLTNWPDTKSAQMHIAKILANKKATLIGVPE